MLDENNKEVFLLILKRKNFSFFNNIKSYLYKFDRFLNFTIIFLVLYKSKLIF